MPLVMPFTDAGALIPSPTLHSSNRRTELVGLHNRLLIFGITGLSLRVSPLWAPQITPDSL